MADFNLPSRPAGHPPFVEEKVPVLIRIHFNIMYHVTMVLALFTIFACKQSVPEFSGENAFKHLEEQCSFGPRNPGSEGYEAGKDYLTSTLTDFADTVFHQPFQYTVSKSNETFDLTNIIARFNIGAKRQILLGAHWDTRPWADQDPDRSRRSEPILGANDGASGAAVLLELARIFHFSPPPIGITIVLFDGEDLGREGDPYSYAQGALYFAKNLPIPKPESAIVLDMIGDADLNIYIERNSYHQNPELIKSLWNKAAKLKLPAFKNWLRFEIYDDHVPLWEEAGIPSVDLIDFEYPNRYGNYWHTHKDIPANCSAASLWQVGTLLVHYLYQLN